MAHKFYDKSPNWQRQRRLASEYVVAVVDNVFREGDRTSVEGRLLHDAYGLWNGGHASTRVSITYTEGPNTTSFGIGSTVRFGIRAVANQVSPVELTAINTTLLSIDQRPGADVFKRCWVSVRPERPANGGMTAQTALLLDVDSAVLLDARERFRDVATEAFNVARDTLPGAPGVMIRAFTRDLSSCIYVRSSRTVGMPCMTAEEAIDMFLDHETAKAMDSNRKVADQSWIRTLGDRDIGIDITPGSALFTADDRLPTTLWKAAEEYGKARYFDDSLFNSTHDVKFDSTNFVLSDLLATRDDSIDGSMPLAWRRAFSAPHAGTYLSRRYSEFPTRFLPMDTEDAFAINGRDDFDRFGTISSPRLKTSMRYPFRPPPTFGDPMQSDADIDHDEPSPWIST